jgi:DNA primase
VLALHQAGLRNVVGQQGTALTEGQAAELAKLAPTVVLCLDADRAGQDATVKAAGVLRGLGTPPEVRVATLPAGQDPADLATKDVEAARALLTDAAPLARWQVELALERGDLGSTEGRDHVLDYAAPVINRLPQGLLRSELTRMLGDRLGLSEAVVAARLSDGGRAAPIRAANGAPSRRPFAHTEEAERAFLAMCLALPQSGPDRLEANDPDVLFATELGRRAAAHLRENFDAPMAGLASEDPLSVLMAELVMRARGLEDPDPAELDRSQRMLDLARLDRQIAAARAAETPVGDLAAERQEVLTELRRLTV